MKRRTFFAVIVVVVFAFCSMLMACKDIDLNDFVSDNNNPEITDPSGGNNNPSEDDDDTSSNYTLLYAKYQDGWLVESYVGTGAMLEVPATKDEKPVLAIGDGAFAQNNALTTVKLPASVTYIGEEAFDRCAKLRTVTFADNSRLTSIGNSAFFGCIKLADITLPESVTTIGQKAFGYCNDLASVQYKSVTTIGQGAFANCDNLTSVHYKGTLNDWCKIEFEDSTANPLSNGADLYVGGSKVTNLTIPQGVTDIKPYAFTGCKSITSITIPQEVETIGKSAFSGCDPEAVTFAVTDGWNVSHTAGDMGEFSPLQPGDLSTAAAAATLLCVTYADYYWEKANNNPNKLEIYILNQGYGYEWCQEVLNAFKEEEWVKEKYPELKTSIYKDEVQTTAVNMLAAGSRRNNKYDLLFGTNLTTMLGPNADCLNLADIVYNTDVPGESVTVKDKMIPSALESARYVTGDPTEEEQYYMMNWFGGMMGIMYNKTQFDKLKRGEESVELPRTTDEFIDILTGIKDGSITGWVPTGGSSGEPFATYMPSTYIDFVSNVWWAQYDGVDGYNDFYNGRVETDFGTNYGTEVITNAVGLKKTYEMLERFLPDDKITWNNAYTGRNNYIDTQNKILTGEHMFMVNGDWVMNELKSLYDGLIEMGRTPDTVSIMPVPVLSSIIDKTPTINDDETLSKVIKAIDEGKTFENCTADIPGVSEADWNKIYEARHVVYSTGPRSSAFIPSYAAGKGPAADFLRYLATDKAQEIYMEVTKGCMLPFQYDTSNEKYIELYNGFPELNKAALNVLLDPDVEFLLPEDYFPLCRFGQFTINEPEAHRAEAIRAKSETPESLLSRMKYHWDENNRFDEAKSCLPYKPWNY